MVPPLTALLMELLPTCNYMAKIVNTGISEDSNHQLEEWISGLLACS